MTILDRVMETRGVVNLAHPRDPVLAQWWGGSSNTAAGINVTPDKAMRLASVFAAVRIIAESVASLPLIVYERLEGGGKSPATNHPLYPLLHDQPNQWQTAIEFREMMQGHVTLRGNAYAEIISGNATPVKELIPMHPDHIRPFRAPDRSIAYDYHPGDGPVRVLLQDEVFHLRGLSSDGIVGMCPIDQARESVGAVMAAEEFGARFFGNGTNVGGFLEHPGKLSEEAQSRLIASWKERQGGVSKAHSPAVLEEGMKWTAIGIEPDKAQFLETRKFGVADIARLFRIPPHMLGDLEKATFSNIEQQAIEFVVHTLRSWLVRWEQAISRDLLTTAGKQRYFAEHKVDGLLRGDSKARGEFYSKMFQMAALSPNNILELENMNPVEGGDQRFVPLNMVPLDQAGQIDEQQGSRMLRQRLADAHTTIFRHAADRIVTSEVKGLRRALNSSSEFETRAVEFFSKHEQFIYRHLSAPVETLARSVAVCGVSYKDPAPFLARFAKAINDEAISEVHNALIEDGLEVCDLLAQWEESRAALLTARVLVDAEIFLLEVHDGD